MLYGKDLSITDALSVSLIGMLVVLAELALIAGLIYLISYIVRNAEKRFAKDAPAATVSDDSVPVQSAPALPATQSRGSLTLIDVDEPTAAVIMAIVSDNTKIPLNRLDFKSIKRLED